MIYAMRKEGKPILYKQGTLTMSVLQNKKNRKKRAQNLFSPQLVLSAKFLSDSHLTVHHRMHFMSAYRFSVTERPPLVTNTALLSMSWQWLLRTTRKKNAKLYQYIWNADSEMLASEWKREISSIFLMA